MDIIDSRIDNGKRSTGGEFLKNTRITGIFILMNFTEG